MNVNLKGAMWCCKYCVPLLRQSGGGSIINTSSIAGVVGLKDKNYGLTAYSTAKVGISGLTRSLAAELADESIRVNCIVVGMVDTPHLGAISEATRERRRKAVPLQSKGTGWDVAWAAVYLASDESRWVTGIELPVDAGQNHLFARPS